MSDSAAAPVVDPGATLAPATPAATPEATASTSWYSGASDEMRGYIENKGWKDALALADSYRNVEKLLGASPDQIVKLPKSDAPPEAWGEVWNKLGRPADAAGYGFAAPEGDTTGFAKWAGDTFHALGIPAEMGKQLAEKFGEFQQQVMTANTEAVQQARGAEVEALKAKWGAAHDQNIGMAKQAAANLGVDGAVIDAMEDAIGFAKTIEFFHSLGAKMGEGSFVSGNSGGQGILSPEAAQSRIAELRKDEGWTKRYLAGDAKARGELRQLHQWAYPGE